MTQRAAEPVLTVIMPVFNAEAVLGRVFGALEHSTLNRAKWELVVVDDGSTDSSVEIAGEHADRVVRVDDGPSGPASARNAGARVARGEVLVFVDSDVCVRPDALRRFLELFDAYPDVAAAFGAYDTEPASPDFISQYRNLVHHYVHASAAGDAETFWAGLGAVRKRVFLEVGMYDAERFPRPQIEDIELGYRLRDRGHRILLDPEIQGTHLKRWGFAQMVRTDVVDRGVPWMRLLLERPAAEGSESLNVKRGEKIKTGLVGLSLVAVAVAIFTLDAIWLAIGAALAVIVVISNRRLYGWFAEQRGPWFAVRVMPIHFLYYILNGFSAVAGMVLHRLGRRVRTALQFTGPRSS